MTERNIFSLNRLRRFSRDHTISALRQDPEEMEFSQKEQGTRNWADGLGFSKNDIKRTIYEGRRLGAIESGADELVKECDKKLEELTKRS